MTRLWSPFENTAGPGLTMQKKEEIMDPKIIIEAVGYLGSALVVVSMLMSSVFKLRVINTTGSIIFAIYALIIKSYPTALMNLCLVSINVYHLMKLHNTKKHFELLSGNLSDSYLSYLLSYFKEDIAKYFPDFSLGNVKTAASKVFIVCCDNELAGVLIGRADGEILDIDLDYSTPIYRDCSVGTYLYDNLPKRGIRKLTCKGFSAEHIEYLRKMGFVRVDGNSYSKEL